MWVIRGLPRIGYTKIYGPSKQAGTEEYQLKMQHTQCLS